MLKLWTRVWCLFFDSRCTRMCLLVQLQDITTYLLNIAKFSRPSKFSA